MYYILLLIQSLLSPNENVKNLSLINATLFGQPNIFLLYILQGIP